MAMISFDEAVRIVMSHSLDCGVEPLSIQHCNGRILAQDVLSDIDFPPFDESVVDGYVCRATDIVLKAGMQIEPAHIGVLAGVGCVVPIVAKFPKIGILATGKGLVAPTQKPSQTQIREMNGYQVRAQFEELGIGCSYYGVIDDDEARIEQTLLQAMDDNDIVLAYDGSPLGDVNFVPKLLEKHCSNMLINKVDINLGESLLFATYSGGVCFGMTGNPLSSYVLAELLIKPFVLKSMGHSVYPRIVPLKLNEDFKIQGIRNQTFIPVRLVDQGVERVSFHGSAPIHAMCNADGLAIFPLGKCFFAAGTLIEVQLLI